jgi:hypothetical protein
MLANNGELADKRHLSPAAMDELRKEQTGTTKVNFSLGFTSGMASLARRCYGTDHSVHPKTGMIGTLMVQCNGGDQWKAQDLFPEKAASAPSRSLLSDHAPVNSRHVFEVAPKCLPR